MGNVASLPDTKGLQQGLGVSHMQGYDGINATKSADRADYPERGSAKVYSAQKHHTIAASKEDLEEILAWSRNSIAKLMDENAEALETAIKSAEKLNGLRKENIDLRALLMMERMKRKELEISLRALL